MFCCCDFFTYILISQMTDQCRTRSISEVDRRLSGKIHSDILPACPQFLLGAVQNLAMQCLWSALVFKQSNMSEIKTNLGNTNSRSMSSQIWCSLVHSDLRTSPTKSAPKMGHKNCSLINNAVTDCHILLPKAYQSVGAWNIGRDISHIPPVIFSVAKKSKFCIRGILVLKRSNVSET